MPTLSEQGIVVLVSVILAFLSFLIDRNANNPFVQLAAGVVGYYWGKNSK